MADKLRPFLFSCDAHISEPPDLFSKNMPKHLASSVITAVKEGNKRVTRVGDQIIFKMWLDVSTHKTGLSDSAFQQQNGEWSTAQEAGGLDSTRRGVRDLALRAADMDRDGVDAELVFPSMGLMLPRITDREGQRVACQIYNDWAWDYCEPLRERLIPAAMIPCIDFDDALAECKRTAAKGYAAFCLWEGLNNYNDPRWDPIFKFAGENNIPIVFHTGLGNINIRALKNPGGALYNYTRQVNDAIDIITQLIAGGVLDRNPNTHILFAEHSAGWLWGLAERMDEVYRGHAPSIEPKLSRLPSQIVRDQVHCALQNDTGSIASRRGVGIDALLFATDYPHSEGTFPISQSIVDRMMAEHPDCSLDEFAMVLGGNAAKLFKRANLQPAVDARMQELKAAA